jgi:peptide/nickel transport system permease protein
MTLEYFVRRVIQFFVIVFLAVTLNFFFPRMSGQDPIREKLAQLEAQGVSVSGEGLEEFIATYNAKFGLDKPLLEQYLTYLGQMARLDLGQSIAFFPTTVGSMLRTAIPWSIGLLLTATLMSFTIGTLVGALIGWGNAPPFLKFIFPAFFVFSAVPFYLMGLLLLYVFAFQFRLLPLFGGYSTSTLPEPTLDFALEVLRHSILPALSIVLATIGYWALGMRSMMVTIEGEDYILQAEAKGLKKGRIFFRYAMRNAILPQITALAMSLGTLISGAILVEVIFAYPGVGSVLVRAILGFDWFVIQGTVFMIILTVAFSMLIIDLIYPLIDPRISYRGD